MAFHEGMPSDNTATYTGVTDSAVKNADSGVMYVGVLFSTAKGSSCTLVIFSFSLWRYAPVNPTVPSRNQNSNVGSFLFLSEDSSLTLLLVAVKLIQAKQEQIAICDATKCLAHRHIAPTENNCAVGNCLTLIQPKNCELIVMYAHRKFNQLIVFEYGSSHK